MSATSRRTRRRANEADTQPVIHLRGAALLQSNFINFRILPERSCTTQQGRARAPMFMLRVHDRIAVLHAVREIVDTLPRPAGAQTLAAKKEQTSADGGCEGASRPPIYCGPCSTSAIFRCTHRGTLVDGRLPDAVLRMQFHRE